MRRIRGGIDLSYELIADVADGAQPLGLAGVVLDLLTNPAYMHIDGAHIADERIVPKLRQQLLATEHLLRMLHEEAEQIEGTRLERKRMLAAPRGVRRRIEEQIA